MFFYSEFGFFDDFRYKIKLVLANSLFEPITLRSTITITVLLCRRSFDASFEHFASGHTTTMLLQREMFCISKSQWCQTHGSMSLLFQLPLLYDRF